MEMTRDEAIAVLNMVEAHGSLVIEAKDMAIKALELVEEFEKAQIITGGRLNGRTYAYKCGLADGIRKASNSKFWEFVKPTPKWIPVKERLPKESLNSVIGWDAYRERCVFVQYIDGCFQITGKNESFDIIAWIPLPLDYKEEKESE
jgi:hypothetical protein